MQREPGSYAPRPDVDEGRLRRALRHLQDWIGRDAVPSVTALVLHRGVEIARYTGGDAAPDTLYYLASITKPITATAAMLMVQDGKLLLDDPVGDYLPQFTEGAPERGAPLIRHFLTHTSGLPDMVPENLELRRRFAGLEEFAASACRAPLLFPPGSRVSYSSAGLLLLARIVEQVCGRTLQELLSARLFRPLGLEAMTYHLPYREFWRVARLRLRPGDAPTPWDNNSPYWRMLGAPWGGIAATVDDVARLGQFFLDLCTGQPEARRDLMSTDVARLMTSPQTAGLPAERSISARWGLGWALGAHWMGDLATLATFGHVGASGTMLWVDPPRRLVCCVLTNRLTEWSTEWRPFAAFSTALMAAVDSTGEGRREGAERSAEGAPHRNRSRPQS